MCTRCWKNLYPVSTFSVRYSTARKSRCPPSNAQQINHEYTQHMVVSRSILPPVRPQGIYSAGFQRGVGSLHLSAARGWCRLKYHSTRSPGDHGFMEREMYPPRSVGLWRQYHHIRMVRRKCVNVQAAGLRYDGERRINRSREGRMKKGGTDAKVAREIGEILSRRDMRLALHFDLNKTLLMVDPAGGKTESQVRACDIQSGCYVSYNVQCRTHN